MDQHGKRLFHDFGRAVWYVQTSREWPYKEVR